MGDSGLHSRRVLWIQVCRERSLRQAALLPNVSLEREAVVASAMVTLDTLRALHEHDHQLAAYCAICERWAVLDLEQLIAGGRGDYCFVGRKPRYSYWNTRTRFPRAALCNQLLE